MVWPCEIITGINGKLVGNVFVNSRLFSPGFFINTIT